MPTFGVTANNASNAGDSADRKRVSSATPATSGTVTKLTARVWMDPGGSTVAKAVIYADSTGAPGALLATGDEVTVSNATEAAIDFPFSGAQQIAVAAGTPYWIGVIHQDPGTDTFRHSVDATASGHQRSTDTYLDGPSDPFGTPTALAGILDIYATTTSAVTGTAAVTAPPPTVAATGIAGGSSSEVAYPVLDGWVQSESATYATARAGGGTNTDDWTSTSLQVGQYHSGGTYKCSYALLEFDVTSFVPTITTATLRTETVADNTGALTYDFEARLVPVPGRAGMPAIDGYLDTDPGHTQQVMLENFDVSAWGAAPYFLMDTATWADPTIQKIIKNGTFRDNAGATAKAALMGNGTVARNVLIYNVEFRNIRTNVAGDGLHAINASGDADDVKIVGCDFTQFGADAIQFGGGSTSNNGNWLIEFSDFHGAGEGIPVGVDQWGENGIDIKGVDGPILVNACRFIGFIPTIVGQDASGGNGVAVVIHAGSGSGNATNARIKNCWFSGNAYGITVDTGEITAWIDIGWGNEFHDSTVYDIHVTALTASVLKIADGQIVSVGSPEVIHENNPGTYTSYVDFIPGDEQATFTLLARLAQSDLPTAGNQADWVDDALPANVSQSGRTRMLLTTSRLVNPDVPGTSTDEYATFAAYETSGASSDPTLTLTSGSAAVTGTGAVTVPAPTVSASGIGGVAASGTGTMYSRIDAVARLYPVGAGMPIEVEMYDPQFNPPRLIAVLEAARQPSWTDVLNDPGAFSFSIPAADRKAGERIIAAGNLAKFKLHGAHRFAGWVDQVSRTVASTAGQSGELLTVAGPGAAAMVSRAIIAPPDRTENDSFIAVLLGEYIDEAASAALRGGVLALMSYDWTATDDSNGDPWDDDADWAFPWNTNLSEVWRAAIGMGIDFRMTPDLVLQAYEEGMGTDRSGTVVFNERHLREDVVTTRNESQWFNVAWVRGSTSSWVTVYGDHSDPRRGRREGSVDFSATDSPAALRRAGNAAIAQSEALASAVRLPLHQGIRGGLFTPYLDYAVGDTVGVRIPGLPSTIRVAAITIAGTEGGDFLVDVDAGGVRLDNMVRLRKLIESHDLLQVAGL